MLGKLIIAFSDKNFGVRHILTRSTICIKMPANAIGKSISSQNRTNQSNANNRYDEFTPYPLFFYGYPLFTIFYAVNHCPCH